MEATTVETVFGNEGDLHIGRDPWMLGPKGLIVDLQLFNHVLNRNEIEWDISKRNGHLFNRRHGKEEDKVGDQEEHNAAKHVSTLLFTALVQQPLVAPNQDLTTATTTMGAAIGTSSLVEEDADLIFKEAMSLLQECKQLDHSMSVSYTHLTLPTIYSV